MTAICVPIFLTPKTDVEEVLTEAEEALASAGKAMIELRCDTATSKQVAAALEQARVPAIVTIRPTWEGGFSQKREHERLALFEVAIENGADYIDVELQAWEKSPSLRAALLDLTEKHGTRLIVSNHCFDARPADVPQRLARLRAVKEAHILKIAWKAQSIDDAIEALRLTAAAPPSQKILALAMGEEGQLSRLLAKRANAPFTFASLERGAESAPGQPTVAELLTRYRWQHQTPATRLFGVAGYPIGHSLSPHIHNAGFDAMDIDAVYVPLPIKPSYEAFSQTVNALRNDPLFRLQGLSVTIPHKENAFRYVQENGGQIDELSQHIGVINTILWPPNAAAPEGLNSDYPAAMAALLTGFPKEHQTLAGRRIAVLGAGGAARAIVAALAHANAATTLFNRTFDKAQNLAAEFNAKTGPVAAAPWETLPSAKCDAYINCTPLGMFPKVKTSPLDGLPSPDWSAQTVVFDTVYNPLLTKLLKIAKQKNAVAVSGIEMFIRQAAIQFERFTGKPAPLDVFRNVIVAALKN